MSETNGTPPAPQKIHAAMAAVMKAVGAIGKNQRNDHFRYNFRGIDDVMNALHGPLTEHGVYYVPQVQDASYSETQYQNAKGQSKVQTSCRLTVRYVFYADDGSHVEAVAAGEGVDDADKATNKALSAALKYALLQTFCVPTADIDDSDREKTLRRAGTQQARKPQPAAKPAAKKPADKPPHQRLRELLSETLGCRSDMERACIVKLIGGEKWPTEAAIIDQDAVEQFAETARGWWKSLRNQLREETGKDPSDEMIAARLRKESGVYDLPQKI